MKKYVTTEDLFNAAHIMLGGMDDHLLINIGTANDAREILEHRSIWAGGPKTGPRKSNAPWFGGGKFNELLNDIEPGSEAAVSPVEGDFTTTYEGGMRDPLEGIHRIVTGSGWPNGKCDALIAVILTLMWRSGTYAIHHIGQRYTTMGALEAAVAEDEERYGIKAVHLTAGQPETVDFHHRYYIHVSDAGHSMGRWSREHAHFPFVAPADQRPGKHIDICTPNAESFLTHVTHWVGGTSLWWGEDPKNPNDPLGALTVVDMDEAETQRDLMVRKEWWNIPQA